MLYRTTALILLLGMVVRCATDPLVPQNDPKAPPNAYKDYTALETQRFFYGSESLQYGDFVMPEGDGPFPVVMIIHGGCWSSQYNLTLMDSMAMDLAIRGYATWNIEYRRTGDSGGGWPGTFHDVILALQHIDTLGMDYSIDLDKILVTGHSAGGHLALWLGGYAQVPIGSDLYRGEIPDIAGILSLAGITDLVTYYSPRGCGGNIVNLIGGLPTDFAARYAAGSPISYLPIGIQQILVNGDKDQIVSIAHVSPYYDRANAQGDTVELITVEGSGHFEVITPGSIAWPTILEALEDLVK